jgi:hypothetical protein
MTRFLIPPLAWRSLGRSALRGAAQITAAGLMAAGKLIYVSGACLQQFAEEKLGEPGR